MTQCCLLRSIGSLRPLKAVSINKININRHSVHCSKTTNSLISHKTQPRCPSFSTVVLQVSFCLFSVKVMNFSEIKKKSNNIALHADKIYDNDLREREGNFPSQLPNIPPQTSKFLIKLILSSSFSSPSWIQKVMKNAERGTKGVKYKILEGGGILFYFFGKIGWYGLNTKQEHQE